MKSRGPGFFASGCLVCPLWGTDWLLLFADSMFPLFTVAAGFGCLGLSRCSDMVGYGLRTRVSRQLYGGSRKRYIVPWAMAAGAFVWKPILTAREASHPGLMLSIDPGAPLTSIDERQGTHLVRCRRTCRAGINTYSQPQAARSQLCRSTATLARFEGHDRERSHHFVEPVHAYLVPLKVVERGTGPPEPVAGLV